MVPGHPAKSLYVPADETENLEPLARRSKSSQAMAVQFCIVLDCTEGLSNPAVAKKPHLTEATA